MSKNVVEWDRPKMKIWRTRIACWIPKTTNTHSQYVILIAFPLQQWLYERAPMLHYKYIVLFALRSTERDMIENVYWSFMKSNLCSCRIFMKLEFFDSFFKYSISRFMKIRRVGVESFRADRRTDMEKLTIALRSFANAPSNTLQISSITIDALMNSVHNPSHSTNMTGDTAFFPS
jgi:hypothetical protein